MKIEEYFLIGAPDWDGLPCVRYLDWGNPRKDKAERERSGFVRRILTTAGGKMTSSRRNAPHGSRTGGLILICAAIFGMCVTPGHAEAEGFIRIDGVEITSQGSVDGTSEIWVLLIRGRNFGQNPNDLKVSLVSSDGATVAGTVLSLSGGEELIARFNVEAGFDALILRIDLGEDSDAYTFEDEGEDEVPVYLYWSLMDPKNVSDIFGRRIGKRFIVWQVTVDNEHKEQKLLIHDLSLDLSEVSPGWAASRNGKGEMSSRELSILRGVAEKGKLYDWRNMLLRLLRGAGTIAAGLVGVAGFGPSYAGSVAILNGPVVAAYAGTYPDLSDTQMLRLNDSAYIANTIVPQQQSRVVVVFMPQQLLLNKEQRKKFWNEPTSLWKDKTNGVDLRKVRVILDYDYIIEVEDIPPELTDVVVTSEEMSKFQEAKPTVTGFLLGNFLRGSEITLTEDAPEGLSVTLGEGPSEKRLPFILESDRPVPSGSRFTLRVTKGDNSRTIPVRVNYTAIEIVPETAEEEPETEEEDVPPPPSKVF